MIAWGSFAPYLLCAPYLASIFIETIVIITIEIWVKNDENPSFKISSKILPLINKSFNFNLNDFGLNK